MTDCRSHFLLETLEDISVFRPLRTDGNGEERILADAQRRLHSSSLALLEKWFPGLSLGSQSEAGSPPAPQLSEMHEELQEMLREDALLDSVPMPEAEIVGRSRPLGMTEKVLEPGSSIVVRQMHLRSRHLMGLCRHISVALAAGVNSQIQVGLGHTRFVDGDASEDERLVIQLVGTSRWEISEAPATDAPHDAGPTTATKPPVPPWRYTLTANRVLLVPADHFAIADTSEYEMSAHIVLSLRGMRWIDVWTYLAGFSRFSPLFRADIPFSLSDRSSSYNGSLVDTEDSLTRAVSDLTTPENVEFGLAKWRARLPAFLPSEPSKVWSAICMEDWSTMTLRMVLPGGVVVPAKPAIEVDDLMVVAFADRVLTLMRHTVPALALLLQGDRVSFREFATRCGPVDCECPMALARLLVGAGFVEVDMGSRDCA